ncbi:hypothetical protein [Aquidulcibacter sp.]|uniref:hypothetical protein n=1 Tax=Aquidulcibacter sp. TaxID=2052990 RepID=UPI0025C1B0DE|nr:hypothetical protein [Aquidulcibacter sp.]MCA3696328.1 hypothetical protein [Aquidulcibacter sp.]
MEATPHTSGEPIILSHIMPTPIRLIFGGVGLALTILLLVELGPALWPPSFLTLFFGIIVLGGLSVTLAFVAGSALGPDQTWEIRPRKLTITYQLFNQTSVKTYDLRDFESCDVASSQYDSDVETYQIVCRLPLGRTVQTGLESTPFLMAILAFLQNPIANFNVPRHAEIRLRSPDFSKREEAERALAHLMKR